MGWLSLSIEPCLCGNQLFLFAICMMVLVENDLLLKGLMYFFTALSVRWRDVQHQYYEWLQQQNTGKTWLQALIKKIW
jgi:hypothetical protein